jgi:hypothetical protein
MINILSLIMLLTTGILDGINAEMNMMEIKSIAW